MGEQEFHEVQVCLIIPFYNEKERFSTEYLLELSTRAPSGFHCYLVDDGSSDGLSEMLKNFILENGLLNVSLVRSQLNLGKANAIRFGFEQIEIERYNFVGFTDADFAAKPQEILRLIPFLIQGRMQMLLGARTKLESNRISTPTFRYLQGLSFNFIIEKLFQRKFLDLQCGLKFFHNNDQLRSALVEPFMNEWLFDLELILRINESGDLCIQEEVLENWTHVGGSKVAPHDVFGIAMGLLKLRFKYGNFNNRNVI